MKRDWQAWIIKFSAVFAAVSRWTGALLAAEGFPIPNTWLDWWIPLSAFMGAFMAGVEGWAFAYVFNAWWAMRKEENIREEAGQKVRKLSAQLLRMVILSAVTFILVLTPYIAAQVRSMTLSMVLADNWTLFAWSACVAASTITIVASVGVAQGQTNEAQKYRRPTILTQCGVCGKKVGSPAEHTKVHVREVTHAKGIPEAIRILREKYPEGTLPTPKEIAAWLKRPI